MAVGRGYRRGGWGLDQRTGSVSYGRDTVIMIISIDEGEFYGGSPQLDGLFFFIVFIGILICALLTHQIVPHCSSVDSSAAAVAVGDSVETMKMS